MIDGKRKGPKKQSRWLHSKSGCVIRHGVSRRQVDCERCIGVYGTLTCDGERDCFVRMVRAWRRVEGLCRYGPGDYATTITRRILLKSASPRVPLLPLTR